MPAAFHAPAKFARKTGVETSSITPELPSVIGSMTLAPAILSRNGVRYLRCRTWRADAKRADLATFKAAKVALEPDLVSGIADDIELMVGEVFGTGFFRSVVPVACGHSKRPNCLSVRIAVELAARLGAESVKAFADRYVSGVSHPKEFAKLPPLEIVTVPMGHALIVNDVATSGFHMHEAITALRGLAVPTFGIVWVSGVKQG